MLKHLSDKKGEGKYRIKMMAYEYNINIKKILAEHLKLLHIIVGLLDRIDEDLTDAEYARATTMRVKTLEGNDSDELVFKRRMGLRTYFKEIRMHTTKIRDLKQR